MVDWQEIFGKEDPAQEQALEALFISHFPKTEERSAKIFAKVWQHECFKQETAALWEVLGQTGSASRALHCISDCINENKVEHWSSELISSVLFLAGASPRAGRLLIADPTLVSKVNKASKLSILGLEEEVIEFTSLETKKFEARLRQFRNREILGVALAELRGVDVLLTAAQITALAEICVRAALAHHEKLVCASMGLKQPPCEYTVIGMGKLGGNELNFSSDIDLLYFYARDHELSDEGTSHEYFVRLFGRMQKSLSQVTEDGFVFRVDTDLRPEGRKGPLANSIAGAERYYQTWGQTWERAAWIKARPIAGDEEFGAQVLRMMQAFVFRKSLDFSAIEEIVTMKKKVDQENRRHVRGRLKMGINVKLGIGGIREIEFFVQAQQLLYGGRQAQVRNQNTLESLKRLESVGLVNALTRETLVTAYRLLRLVEHRLQIVEDQQTHTIPTDSAQRLELARTLGLKDAEALTTLLKENMSAVHEYFSALLASSKDEQEIPDAIVDLLDERLDDKERIEVLHAYGARHPFQALSSITAAARVPKSPFHPRAPSKERRLAQLLLQELVESPDVDRALKYLPELIRGCTLHHGFLSQLHKPSLRRGISRVLGASDLVARILVSSPSLLQSVLIESESPAVVDLNEVIQKRLAHNKADLELALGTLRKIKQKEILRLALADMANQLPLESVSLRLTKMAEVFVEWAMKLAAQELKIRYGALRDSELVVIAGGSLGAYELGYRTDLDLGFVYRGSEQSSGGTRGQIGTSEYYTRLAQRAIQYLSLKTHLGDLYPVDMRLRPSGRQGALITSLDQFTDYHSTSAQLWERQALTRTRSICGPSTFRDEIDEVITSAVYGQAETKSLRRQICDMRLRLQEESVSRSDPSKALDLKRGRGGLVEIEFIVQFLLLAHGNEHPEIRNTSTREALRALGERGLLLAEDMQELLLAHAELRSALNWLRLTHDEAIDHLLFGHVSVRALAMSLGYEGKDASLRLQKEIDQATDHVHDCYLRILDPEM